MEREKVVDTNISRRIGDRKKNSVINNKTKERIGNNK